MNPTTSNSPDIQISFDVGHSSLGWAVLSTGLEPPQLLGCGSVIFGADDCLASKRRTFRRQRRHTRSTRQRIARMEKLLVHLGVMSAEQIADKHAPAGGHAAPWLLAARVLASGGAKEHLCKTWAELWDVLRWYAHNRGYDGNARWSNAAESALSEAEMEEMKADTDKEKKAVALMDKYQTKTMAETVFADLFAEFRIRDPLTAPDRLPFLKKYFKGNQCAFPRNANNPKRDVVITEVRRILEAHRGALAGCDDRFIGLLIATNLPDAERAFLREIGIPLPSRYEGGLLFGQLVPRFDNRIIGECVITGEHVPTKNCSEFLDFRWAMKLSDIRIGFGDETYGEDRAKLRAFDATERRKVDARVRALGFLKVEPDKVNATGLMKPGRNELREIVTEETHCDRHNLDTLLMHPDAKEALNHVPKIHGSTVAFRVAWRVFESPREREIHRDGKTVTEYLDDPLRQRFLIQLLRGKILTPAAMVAQLEKIGRPEVAERVRVSAREEATDKRGKVNEEKVTDLIVAEFHCEKLKGRARYARHKLRAAVQQAFHPTQPVHPLQKDGCLEQTDAVKRRGLERPLTVQTNNHLVRHRLLILQRLFNDLVTDYAGGQKKRIARIIMEVARDLQTMSGMTNKEKAKELTIQLKNHHDIAAELAEKLRDANGQPLRYPDGRIVMIGAGLIRKARILADLGGKCPYSGREIELVHLLDPHRVDKDHIVPRTQRLSDALEAQVITFKAINREKKNRTALEFIKDMSLPENREIKDRLGLFTEAQFREFVDKLKTKGGHPGDVRRREARKKLLLLEKYEEKDFTPGDLTKTSHIAKLGAQQLEATFLDMPEAERPPVIAVTGAVTKAFRDRSWNLLPLLGAANEQVTKALAEGARKREQGGDFNPKKAIRDITHLHHALDATALALLTAKLVGPGHRSLDGKLSRFIVKGKLTKDERDEFLGLVAQFRLPQFWKWGPENQLYILDLDESLKDQIRTRLAEKRVVQHIPVDMGGLHVEENTRGIASVENGRVYLNPPVMAKGSEIAVSANKLVGFNPPDGKSKLQPQRGVRMITDNYGVAILDHCADEARRLVIIPWHKVWARIHRGWTGMPSLKELNGGKMPRILRNGMVIRIGKFKVQTPTRVVLENSEWTIHSIGDFDGTIKVDLKPRDVIRTRYDEPDPNDPTGEKTIGKTTPGCKLSTELLRVYEGGLEIVNQSLTGQRKTQR